MRAAGIIVAGGKGKRYGGAVRKQYLKLNGRPLYWWSIRAFEKAPSIQFIVLVVPPDDLPHLERFVRQQNFKKLIALVSGGKERSDSVRNGLAAVPSHFEWVAVHDAVRPLVTPELVERTLAAAQRCGAAIAAYPSRDTVKLSRDGKWVAETQRRDTVWLAQTPQSFSRTVLDRAHRKFSGKKATDDSQMIEWLGLKVKLVEGAAENIKVTIPADLEMAAYLLQKMS